MKTEQKLFNCNKINIFTEEQIAEAIDIASGDDGHMAEKTISILRKLAGEK